jgi:transcriptional regulator with XRE-family HTH domain
MNSVGEILRGARESQGREMAQIAEELCITKRYLHALECDDLNSLPGTFFYKSFVKQYATSLGVPLSKLQSGIEAITAPEAEPQPMPGQTGAEKPARSEPAPIRVLDPLVEASNHYFSNRKIGIPMVALAVVLLACSGFYSWWNQPPSQSRAPRSRPTASSLTAAASRTGAQTPIVDVSTSADDVNHVVLNLAATEKTWLSITNSEGEQIFSGMLEASQTKTLTASDAAKMRVGNAGGIAVRLNGKEIGPLGERGQVRTILFTADKFEIVEQPPRSPPDNAPL